MRLAGSLMGLEPVADDLCVALAEMPAKGTSVNGLDDDQVTWCTSARIDPLAMDGDDLAVVQGADSSVNQPVTGQVGA